MNFTMINEVMLEKNDIKMYSTHNEAKCVIAERFIRTLQIKIYKDRTSVSKIVCIEKLDDIVNKYNNTYYSTIKMKHFNVKPNTYIDSSKEINDKNSKFKISDNVTILKYKNAFAKEDTPNWLLLWFKKVKNTVACYILLMI